MDAADITSAQESKNVSQIVSRSQSEDHDTNSVLTALYAPIAEEFAAVQRVLREEMRSEYPDVDELVRYGCLLGGKRLRPALLLLTGKAVGKLSDDHVTLAAVIEMIHTATLVHDDVLDEADTRRHLATVNSRWDSKSSVLLGDFLFTHAFYLASTTQSTWACRQIGRATNIVCEGELRQKGCRGDFSLSEPEYLEIVSAKTAELCACACQLGAHYAGATDELVEQMAGFGRDLGVAFQIVDDLLDVLGDELTTGKSLGTDLEQQKLTLPAIRALQLAGDSERQEILAVLDGESPDRRSALASHLKRYAAIDYAYDKAGFYIRRACGRLEALPASPARQVLKQIAEFVLARSS